VTTTSDKALVAYIVTNSNEKIEISEFKLYLADKIPMNYMPKYFVLMDSFPLNSNGKVDRKLLPTEFNSNESQKIKLPSNELEEKVLNCWREILKTDKFGVADNFFDVGGDSLMSIKLLLKINVTIKKNIPLLVFYEKPTVESFCKFVSENVDFQIDLNLENKIILNEVITYNQNVEKIKSTTQTIFITGVTGFLGAYLLSDLLLNSNEMIYCLVRAKDGLEGLKRIKINLKKFNLWKNEFETRLAIVIGDLSKYQLGMTENDWKELSRKINIVYHNGAKVNFLMPYSLLEKENVMGTHEVLKFCSINNSKKLFYVSTVSVFDSSEYTEKDILDEHKIPTSKNLFSGYAQSKWVAEELVKTAFNRGLKGIIFRPGTITGDSKTGVTSVDDLMTKLFLTLMKTSCAPILNRKFDMIPVDFVSKSIVAISKNYTGLDKIFHLTNPSNIELVDLINLFRSLDYKIEELNYWKWVEKLNSMPSHPLQSLMSLFDEKINSDGLTQAQLSEKKPPINSKMTNRLLEEYDLTCPSIDSNLLKLYTSWCEKIND
jgi:thioester reductase-like protein